MTGSKKKSGKLNHDQDLAHIVHPDDSMLDESYSKPMHLKHMQINLLLMQKKMNG